MKKSKRTSLLLYITSKIRANQRNRASSILLLHLNDLNAAAVVGVAVAAAVVVAATTTITTTTSAAAAAAAAYKL